MRCSLIVLAVCFAPLRAADTAPLPQSPVEARYREGLYAEEAKQDLAAAAKVYEEIVRGFERDRETAASALFRLAEVYRKQNRPKEAAAAFRRVVEEFPGREPLVRLARENLKALGEPLPPVPGAAAPGDPEEDRALARLLEISRTSPDLPLNPQTGLNTNGCISYDEALRAGYTKVVSWLLEHGASAERTPSGAVPLSLAAERGHTGLMEMLLAKGAPVDGPAAGIAAPSLAAPPAGSVYPLYAAAEKGHSAAVTLLLDKGAAINGAPGRRELAPLIIAARKGNRAVVEVLLSRGANPEVTLPPPPYPVSVPDTEPLSSGDAMVEAVLGQHPGIVQLLLTARPSLSRASRVFRYSPASPQGGSGVWEGLPRAGFYHPDHLAYGGIIGRNSIQVNSGGMTNAGGVTKRVSAPDSDRLSALHLAAMRPSAEIVEALVKAGANVNARSPGGSTPLEFACVFQSAGAARKLIGAGARVDVEAPGGLRLVDVALYQMNFEIYELLKAGGAAVTGESSCCATALEMFCRSYSARSLPDAEWVQGLARLIADGANPDGNERCRPVQEAAARGSIAAVQLLKSKGANFRPPGADSLVATALPAFQRTRDPALLKALVEAGADINGSGHDTKDGLAMLCLADPPDRELIGMMLSLNPDPVPARRRLLEVWSTVDGYLKAVKSGTPYDNSGRGTINGMPNINGRALAPAMDEEFQPARKEVLELLWRYQISGSNPGRAGRVWYQSTAKDGDEARHVLWPAGNPGERVPLELVLGRALGLTEGAEQEPWGSYRQWKDPAPDLTRLVIRRQASGGGAPPPDETVNLTALLQDSNAALPVLNPGDTLLAEHTAPSLRSWENLPAPLPERIQKLYSPVVTLTGGDWKQSFELEGSAPYSGSRLHDPSSRQAAVRPRLSAVLGLLPRPLWFYRSSEVKLQRKSGEVLTVDAGQVPLPREKDYFLGDGDAVSVAALPLDDPALRARAARGIFIGREKDGFLEEVFTGGPLPEVTAWTEDLKKDVIQRFCRTSRYTLPWMDNARQQTRPVFSGTAGGESPWGQVLEVPRGADSGDWTGPVDWSKTNQSLLLMMTLKVKISAPGFEPVECVLPLTPPRFENDTSRSYDWTGKPQSESRTLEDVVAALRNPSLPTPGAEGPWELRRAGTDKPALVFVPGKTALPLLLLRDGDEIAVESANTAQRMVQLLTPTPRRTRVVLPSFTVPKPAVSPPNDAPGPPPFPPAAFPE